MHHFLAILANALAPENPNPDPFSLEEVPLQPIPENNFLGEFVYMLLMLGILITAVYLASWFLKRMLNTRIEQINTTSNIKILERRPLSAKATLYLVESEGRTLLIAETPAAVTLLQDIKQTD